MLPVEHQIVTDQVKDLLNLLPVLSTIERGIVNNPTDMQYLANTAYIARKIEDILDSIKKRVKDIGEAAEAQACMRFATTGSPKYSTEYCTISPNSDLILKFPSSPRDEGYNDFVAQLPPEAIRPHYPTVCELIMKQFETVGDLPFGLKPADIKGSKLKCRVTMRKEL